MPARTLARPVRGSRRRLALVLGAVLVVLAAVNVADKYGPPRTGLVAGPLVALGLVLLGRRAGLRWYDWDCPGVPWRPACGTRSAPSSP